MFIVDQYKSNQNFVFNCELALIAAANSLLVRSRTLIINIPLLPHTTLCEPATVHVSPWSCQLRSTIQRDRLD